MFTADLGVIVPIGGKQLKAYPFESLPGESFHLPVFAAALIVSDVHCTHSGKGESRSYRWRSFQKRRAPYPIRVVSCGLRHRVGLRRTKESGKRVRRSPVAVETVRISDLRSRGESLRAIPSHLRISRPTVADLLRKQQTQAWVSSPDR